MLSKTHSFLCQTWRGLVDNEGLWKALFQIYDQQRYNESKQEHERHPDYFPTPIHAPTTLAGFHEQGVMFASWKEACFLRNSLACGVNDEDSAPKPAGFS